MAKALEKDRSLRYQHASRRCEPTCNAEARYGERAHGDSKFRRGSGRGGEWSPSNDATSASGIGLGFHVFGHRSNPRHLPFLIVERYGGHPRCLATRWGTRIPLRARRFVARLSGYRFIPCDPVLRDRESEPARRKAWVRDQYQQNGVEYVVRTQVQCCARSRRSCSLTPKTTGGLRVGWRNLDGFGP